MKFRNDFASDDKSKDTKDIDSYIRSESKDSPLFLETFTNDQLNALEKLRRTAVLDKPNNAFIRQAWLHQASVARDARYARARRIKVKAVGLNGLYMENYGLGKVAYDSFNEKS